MSQNLINIKDRVFEYINYKSIKQVDFFNKTGIASSNFRGKSRQSELGGDSIAKILTCYGDINAEWLITGEGPMLKDEIGNISETQPKSNYMERRKGFIRYWVDVDATGGNVEFDNVLSNKVIDLSIPEFRDCTDAVNLYGDSMSPRYKPGQIIILKEWKESFIEFGNVYLVITKTGHRTVKYLRRADNPKEVLCVSANEEYDPFTIEKDDIVKLYIVKGAIEKTVL